MMRFTKTVITAGFAMFSMFFGSGNLVFPLAIGTETLDKAPWAMFGLFISGVIVPFLGLIGVILFAGNRLNFFSSIGKYPAFILTFFMLAMMGPIGVIPRCIIVAYGGFSLYWPNLGYDIFAVLFCLVTLVIIWNHDRVVPIIGRLLTPFLLLGIVVVIIAGIFFSDNIIPPGTHDGIQSFSLGFIEGYQIMDLLAAFFFSATTVAYIRAHLRSDDRPNTLLKLSIYASLIGAGFLGLIYICFVYLGAKHATELLNVDPQQMLAHIAGLTMGTISIPVVSITILLACLTTATVLAMLFADFLHDDISKKKFNLHWSIIITLVISLLVSKIGFGSLKVWIGTVLKIAYPALIVLTITNIIHKIWGFNFSRWTFWAATTVSTACYFLL